MYKLHPNRYLVFVILSLAQIYLQRRVILTPPRYVLFHYFVNNRLQTCLETTHIVEPKTPPKNE